MATIDTCGSPYDTVPAVYTGARTDSLALLADNDDWMGDGLVDCRGMVLGEIHQARLTLPVALGVSYQIAVMAYGPEGQGETILNGVGRHQSAVRADWAR
jgi:hypothetical protein